MSFFGKVGNFLFGEPAKQKSIYNPQQEQLLQQLIQSAQTGPQSNPAFQSGQDYLQNLLSGSPESTAAFEAPYRQQFQNEIIPGIAERFAGQGAGNQSSSAFTNALGSAGSDYTTGLAALRNQLQMQALPHALNYAQAPFQNLQNVSNIGLNRSPYQDQQGSPGFLAPILGALTGGFTGGIGTGVGTSLGNIIGNWFKPQTQTQPQASSASLG